jgi:hypothetical protein
MVNRSNQISHNFARRKVMAITITDGLMDASITPVSCKFPLKRSMLSRTGDEGNGGDGGDEGEQ